MWQQAAAIREEWSRMGWRFAAERTDLRGVDLALPDDRQGIIGRESRI